MNILENNLALLKKHNKILADKIKNHSDVKAQFSLNESMSGDVILYRNGVPLHDKIDPEQEAVNFLKKIENKGSAGFNYIYGLGLGYILKRFYKSLDGYIIVYEQDLDVLRLTLEMVDFSEELSSKKVFIFDNFDDIDTFYQKYFFYNYSISTTIQNTYKDFEFDKVKDFISHLGYIHGLYASNFQTYWNKHHSWVKSLVNNMNFLDKFDEVKVLKNKFNNKPAIIISAGPSLNKTIELIEKNQDKFIIFCVGTALSAVVKHNIKPDFVCFVEYLPVTARMLDNIDLSYSNIILQPSTCKEIFEANSKNKFLFYADNDDASAWLAKKFNINQSEYINRGTVSVNALVSAKITGCNPIILTGQDLAYTDNKCYADGSIYDNFVLENDKVLVNDIANLSDKTKQNEEKINNRAKSLTKQLYKVQGQNGEILTSPGDYASFIKYFEIIANDYGKDTKLYNSSPGGAQINGYENVKFEDLLEKYDFQPLNKEVLISKTEEKNYKNILSMEIAKTKEIFNKYYKTLFNNAYNEIESVDVELKNREKLLQDDIYIKVLPVLLKAYKQLRLLPKTDLLELILLRDTFMADFYIKNVDLKQHSIYLSKILFTLFNSDYKNFILPLINQINELNI